MEKRLQDYIVETSLSRLYSKIQNHSVGAITAHRGEKTSAENSQRNRQLASYLSNKGYQLTVIDGGYVENPGTEQERTVTEKTFFVVNPVEGDDGGDLEQDLVQLGKLFDQDSILSYPHGGKPTYIGTSSRPDADPALGERYQLSATEWGNPSGPYFSRARGRKFAFKEVRDYEAPTTVNGKTTQYLRAQEVVEQLLQLGK